MGSSAFHVAASAASGVPQIATDLPCRRSWQHRANIVAKVPEERPRQGNSAIIESECPIRSSREKTVLRSRIKNCFATISARSRHSRKRLGTLLKVYLALPSYHNFA